MRTFGEQPQATQQQTKLAEAAKQSPVLSGPRPGLRPAAQLQRTLGNQAVQRLMISPPGDPYEREADRVADHLVHRPDQPLAAMQPGSASTAGQVPAPPVVNAVVASPGQPLDGETRSYLEPRFGTDFSRVRVHTDAQAAASARAVRARAYTVGQHIVFGRGQYQPASQAGRWLLAHELAHVLQDGHGSGPQLLRRNPSDASAPEGETDDSWLWSVLSTIGGGLLGEFNEDPTFAEIGVDLGVSLIPYLDQAADARDLSAHLYYMSFREGELERPMRWIGLAFTLIGLIPEIGSAIKGASKLLIRGGRSALEHLDELMQIVRRFTGSASSTIADFAASLRRRWPAITRTARELWAAKLAEVRRLLREVPELFGLQRLIDQIDAIQRASRRQLNQAFAEIDRMITSALDEVTAGLGGPQFAMASMGPDASDLEMLGWGGRSSSWAGHTVDEAAEMAEEIIQAGGAHLYRLERHHTVFVYVLRGIEAHRAGRSLPRGAGSQGFRQIVDDLFPQQLVDLDQVTHELLHRHLNDVLDQLLEPERVVTRVAGQMRDWGTRIVERGGYQAMMRRLQHVTENELLDIVEEAYLRVFRENPGLVSREVERELLAAIAEVRRGL